MPSQLKNNLSEEKHQMGKRRCKHQNRGFCKFKENCKNIHAENICEEFLQNEKCERKGCPFRHPKNCFHWQKNKDGCKWEKTCQYLHIDSKKYSKIEDNDTVFSCDISNIKVACKQTLDEHIKLSHNAIVFSCDQCDHKDTSVQAMTTHKEMLHKKTYSCEYCNFETEENVILTSHIKSNHELSCNLCETKFKTEVSLEMHIKFKHVCLKCKSEIKQDELKSSCIDCKENCCKPCVVDWLAYLNIKEKMMSNAKQMGIIDNEITHDKLIFKS